MPPPGNAALAWIPRPARQWLRHAHARAVFARAWPRALATAPGETPPAAVLRDLVTGWGNPAMSAGEEYLAALYQYAWQTAGPILECGAGLSTLVLGSIAQRRGLRMWSLEHEPPWAQRVQAALRRRGLTAVTVCEAPLRDFGGYAWYDAPLAALPCDFALVSCDGPPRRIPGGRYGLLPIMRPHLRPGCVILMDDAPRVGVQEALARWTTELSISYDLAGRDRPYAVLTFPGPAGRDAI